MEKIPTLSVMLFAIHLSDGLLHDWMAVLATIGAVAMVLMSAQRLSDDEISRIGVFTAAVFVSSQLHFKFFGTSVHLLLNAVTGVVLGRRAVIAIGTAVMLQALLFAHGGVSTWGVNTLTMSLPAILAGIQFQRAIRRWPNRVALLGMLLGLFASALTVALACTVLYFGGISTLATIGVILLVHLPVIGVEAAITMSLVHYLGRVKPEWLGLTPLV